MKPQGHPKSRRLLHRGEFRRVQGQGKRVLTRHLIVLARPNDLGGPRLGVTITKKVGVAVVRNRLRRLIKEAFRRVRPLEGQGLDLVVIPRKTLNYPASYERLAQDMRDLNERLSPRT